MLSHSARTALAIPLHGAKSSGHFSFLILLNPSASMTQWITLPVLETLYSVGHQDTTLLVFHLSPCHPFMVSLTGFSHLTSEHWSAQGCPWTFLFSIYFSSLIGIISSICWQLLHLYLKANITPGLQIHTSVVSTSHLFILLVSLPSVEYKFSEGKNFMLDSLLYFPTLRRVPGT